MQHTTIKMSKRSIESNQNKMSRIERLSQMSQQELLIEQKKREIQAKMEAKRRANNQEGPKKVTKTEETVIAPDSPKDKEPPSEQSKGLENKFSNDGSFLDQFKQLNDKKSDSKFKSFKKYKDKEREKEKEKEKERELEKAKEEPEPEEIEIKPPSPEPDPPPIIETEIPFAFTPNLPPPTFNPPLSQPPPNIDSSLITSPMMSQISFGPPPSTDNITFTTAPPQINLSVAPPNLNPAQIITQQTIGIVTPQSGAEIGPANISAVPPVLQPSTVITQSLPPPTHIFTTTSGAEIVTPPQVLINVPPPPIMPQLLLTPQDQNVLVSTPTSILTTVTLPPPVIGPQNIQVTTPSNLSVPPPVLQSVELTSIPPPNPIQVQNIPQPEPLNTMNIPPPAPLQVSNIPTPSSLQLNQIPDPKPLDLMAIPTPVENEDSFTDRIFIKNVPPPNKGLPPPTRPPTGQIPSLMSQRVLPPPGMNVPPPIMQDVSQPPPDFSREPPPDFSREPPPDFSRDPPPDFSREPPPDFSRDPPRDFSREPPPDFSRAPPPLPNMTVPPPCIGLDVKGGAQVGEFEAMSNLAQMVAECGPSMEDVVRQNKNRDPALWFLFRKDSPAYRQYASLVDKYKREKEVKQEVPEDDKYDPSEIYEPEMALEDDEDMPDIKEEVTLKEEIRDESFEASERARRERKRKSRWGGKEEHMSPPAVLPPICTTMPPVIGAANMISKVTRTDPGLIHYASQSYGSANLSEEDWKKAEENYKVHLLYQDMLRKREEVERLARQGRNKYDYDSDEEVDGGTWEHRLREKEMQATDMWSTELNKQAEGKHHIGDFLPPEELKRFMEKSNAIKEGRQPNISDYKEFKLKEDNIGFKMLQKLGWSEGQGLGQNSSGIVDPVNKGAPRENTQGLGLNVGDANDDEDEYDSYRKRMMLAYRFRPNPLVSYDDDGY